MWLFWDGALVGGTPRTGNVISSHDDLAIGARPDVDYFWVGGILNVYLWRRALSASEVKSLYLDPYQMFRTSRTVYLAGAEEEAANIPIRMIGHGGLIGPGGLVGVPGMVG